MLFPSVARPSPLELTLLELSAAEAAVGGYVASSEAGWTYAPGSGGGWRATVMEVVTLVKLWGRVGGMPHLSPPLCGAVELRACGLSLYICTT